MDTELCQPMSLILPDDALDDDDDDRFLEVVESPKKPAGIVLPPDADLEPLEAKPPRGRQRILVLKRSAAATTAASTTKTSVTSIGVPVPHQAPSVKRQRWQQELVYVKTKLPKSFVRKTNCTCEFVVT